jgi:hypothetical protein
VAWVSTAKIKTCPASLGTPWANIDLLQCLQISLSCGAKATAVRGTRIQLLAKNAGAIQDLIGNWAISLYRKRTNYIRADH